MFLICFYILVESIFEFLEQYRESTNPSESTNLALTEAFNIEYKKNNFFSKFEKTLVDTVTIWTTSQKQNYGPILSICQSSGNGKSRAMHEFSLCHFSTYICIREKNSNGYPSRSPMADFFFENFSRIEDAKIFLISYVLSELDRIEKLKPTQECSKYQQFTNLQPWHSKSKYDVSAEVQSKVLN